ncbi:MAG: hypothetical protein ACR2I2_10205 [Bryobacteraceae bacterium]
MKYGFAVAMAAAALGTAMAEAPRVKRAALAAMEKGFDMKLLSAAAQEPFDLLGNTRGIYLEGYGAVFTAEIGLVYSPTINPFRLAIPKPEMIAVHQRKLRQLPILKENMRQMLLDCSASLDSVPPAEQIVVSVILFNRAWEDTSGLPSQIMMQAERQKLLDVQTGRAARANLENAIKVQEL